MINSLKITFPKIEHLIGEKRFTIFCQEFIKSNRSYSGNLDDYGADLADFFTIKDEKFLSDLAKLEWLQLESYLVKDTPPINIDKLQKLSSEKLFEIKFKLHQSFFSLSSDYNLLGKKKQKQSLKKQSYFIIYRHNFEVEAEKISKGEFEFLNGVSKGLSLYQIYEKYEIDIQSYLQKYLSNSVLRDF